MHDTLPLLQSRGFPPLRRRRLEVLQANIGLTCNQQCAHCHVNASPRRKEQMNRETAELVLRYLRLAAIPTLDLTGGAPELNPHFRFLVQEAAAAGSRVIDRCNLTILEEPGQEDLADFLAKHKVEIVASLPCYLEENVDRQRGRGVFQKSVRGLQRLNRLGYGQGDAERRLNLVYNPQGPTLPPPQQELESNYKNALKERYGIEFDRLLTLCNMPIRRFGSALVSRGEFDPYLRLLRAAHRDENLPLVMCRTLLSVDWQGYVYDCDFNQMLGLGLYPRGNARRMRLTDLLNEDVQGWPIRVADHCYGCTAGQGSSCSGALGP